MSHGKLERMHVEHLERERAERDYAREELARERREDDEALERAACDAEEAFAPVVVRIAPGIAIALPIRRAS